MKYFITSILVLLLHVGCFAQSPVSSILKGTPFKNTFNGADVEQAIKELSHIYKVDDNGVSFVITVDSLPLSAQEIYEYSREYLKEAYKLTKYNIETENQEKGFVIGRGEFNNFEQYAAFPNQYNFSCEHILRIDAKEGRARVCITVKEHDILRTNGNKTERNKVDIKVVSPINPDAENSKKMYNKVFLALAKLSITTLYDVKDTLKSKQSSEVEDW